jgi:hypothetical protein
MRINVLASPRGRANWREQQLVGRMYVCHSSFPVPISQLPVPFTTLRTMPCAESTTWRPALELRAWARWRRTTHVLTRATARSLSPVSTVALCVLPDCGLAGSLGCVALPKEAAGPLGSDMRAAASDGGATRGGRAEGGGVELGAGLAGRCNGAGAHGRFTDYLEETSLFPVTAESRPTVMVPMSSQEAR